MSRRVPPGFAERLLSLCLPGGGVSESVLGDLHERYVALVDSGVGPVRRDLWYGSQVVRVGVPYLVRRGLRVRRYAGLDGVRPKAVDSERPGRGPAIGDLWRDGVIAVRQLRRNPVFTLVAVLTLALGIGVNTAIFSAAKETFRPKLPFYEPDRLVRIYQVPESGSPNISPRAPAFVALAEAVTGLEGIAGSRFTDLTLGTDEGPEWVSANVVSPGWLEVIGVRPVLGRAFTLEEEAQGSDSRVALIGHGAAEARFGGAESALGSTVRLNEVPYTVIGVLPRGFRYPYGVEFWLPFRPDLDDGPAVWAMNIKGRLSGGVSLAQLRGELQAISRRIEGQVPGFSPGMTLTPVPVRQVLLSDEARTLGALSLAVGFVLLIVCTNLANLLLSRAMVRESEFALRSSLGATRGRLIKQSLVESVVLGGAGGAAGVLIAGLSVSALEPLVPTALAQLGAQVSLDKATLGFALALSLGTGLALGVLPALRLSTTCPAGALKQGSRSIGGGPGRRLGRTIVTAELAATLILLTGVGTMVQVFRQAQGVELGYDDSGALVFSLSLGMDRYDGAPERAQFARALMDALASSPGIAAAGATTMFPRHQGNVLAELEAEHRPGLENGIVVNDRLVTGGYLPGIRATLAAGRWLDGRDVAASRPVAMLSESLAKMLWPTESAVGGRLRNRREGSGAPWHEVVGVVRDVREGDETPYSWYRPYSQHAESPSAGEITVFARGIGEGRPPALSEAREAVDRVDSRLPIIDVTTAAGVNAEAVSRERQGAVVGTAFGAFGILLAALGMYGTIGASVARRRREFGVRIALGSDRRSILADVAAEVGKLVLVGASMGLVGGAVLVRLLRSQLESVEGLNVSSIVLAAVVLSVTAFASGAIPAWRAITTDPVEALAAD